MFKTLFDLSVKRNFLAASVFCIVYAIIGGLICGVVSGVICSIFYPEAETFEQGFAIGRFLGPRVAMVVVAAVAIWAISAKNNWRNVWAVVLFLISIPLAFAYGTLGGMLPVAILTTFDRLPEVKDELSNENTPQE